jgi:AbrB family looped-hinge helix DNA binding protein
METSRVGKRGTIVVPVKLRKRFGLKEGDLLVTEEREDGILLRPAVAVPVEIYTPERRAEFLLNNAIDDEDYAKALEEVRGMGIDPKTIPQ